MINRAYRFRIYPNKEQEIILKKTIGCCRYVYNWALNLKSEAYKKEGRKINNSEISRELTKLRKKLETEWLQEVSLCSLQQSLRHLNSAFTNFFKYGKRYPKFKNRKNGGSIKFVGRHFYVKNRDFRVGRVKNNIKIKWSRDLPSKPSSCTISLTPSGQWFVSFVCEVKPKILSKRNKRIGIDLGIKTFVTLSDGTKIKQPKSIRGLRRKLARAQRAHSRKKLGSKNRDKARLKVARVHQKIANTRSDFLHKLSTSIVRENQVISIEDLAIQNMAQKGNRKLSRLIGEQGWREFRTMLEYKAEWYGRELVVIDRFSPSSKTCSCCGKPATLTLKDRVWSCSCGATHDRDVNAARNILAAGIAVSACGVDVRPVLNGRLTLKQEAYELVSE